MTTISPTAVATRISGRRLRRTVSAAFAVLVGLIGSVVITQPASAAAAPPGCASYSVQTWYYTNEIYFGNEPNKWCLHDGNSWLVFQSDLNWVLYSGGRPTWASHTQEYVHLNDSWLPFDIHFQSDGNVVVYNASNRVGWAASHYGSWFSHQPCGSRVARRYAQIHDAAGNRMAHIDFGEICTNGRSYNLFAIDPTYLDSPAVYPYVG